MKPTQIHPDVLAAHTQFGGDLESMQKCYEWHDLKAEILHLREENARIRRETIEEAAKVADRASAVASSEAKALRALKDYSRSKQLDMESAACTNLAATIRALKAEGESR